MDVQPACDLLSSLADKALIAAGQYPSDSPQRADALRLSRRASRVVVRLTDAATLADTNAVYWLEAKEDGRIAVCSQPIRVDDLLREELFDRCPSVALVSATLTTSGTFRFIRQQTGVPDTAIETIVESPFDFAHHAMLVVPQAMPLPDEDTFIDAAVSAFHTIFRHCEGRTLGLFTSYKNLTAVHNGVKHQVYRCYRQGERPRNELTRIFKEDLSSCLFGTDSFWTGIDVPGEACTAVVIDKLPFESPADPVMDAIAARDPNAFRNVILPMAIIAFRQGVGRLIRTEHDVGVVVVLDKRLLTKPYGAAFRKSLPPMPFARRLDAIPHFLAHAKAGVA